MQVQGIEGLYLSSELYQLLGLSVDSLWWHWLTAKKCVLWLMIWLSASSRDTLADGILILKVELIACINIQLFQCLIQQHYTYWSCYEFVRGPNVLWSVLLACILVLAGGFINHVLVTVSMWFELFEFQHWGSMWFHTCNHLFLDLFSLWTMMVWKQS